MSEANGHADVPNQEAVKTVIERLLNEGVELVRLTYCDMQGTARGKEIPLETLEHIVHDGVAFCVANITDGLAGNPTNAPGLAPDRGYPDMRARPILSTLAVLPWDRSTAWFLA